MPPTGFSIGVCERTLLAIRLHMASSSSRNSLLAAVAVAGLAIYVLACTSFSPDDSQIAFPAVDGKTGEFGLSVFHRKTGRVEPVFSFSTVKNLATPRYEAQLLRPQWLDNQRLLAAWPGNVEGGKGDSTTLNVLLLPVEGKGVVRCWQMSEIEDLPAKLAQPLAVAGSGLFLSPGSNLVTRLDLETGHVVSHACRGETIELYPSGHRAFVFYAATVPDASNEVEIGRLDATTFAQIPLQHLNSASFGHAPWTSHGGTPSAFSADGRQVALVSDKGTLRLARAGQPEQIIPLAAGEERINLSCPCFSPRGDTLYAAFALETNIQTNLTFGIVSVPLDGRPAQRTMLFTGPEAADRDCVVYLQPGLSNDGKTLAISSSYLFGDPATEGQKQKDCALFLIDVSKTPHRVRKIALPLPKADHSFAK